MINKFAKIKTPKFIVVGENNIKDIREILHKHSIDFHKVLILVDKKTFDLGGKTIVKILQGHKSSVFTKYINQSDEKTVTQIVKTIKKIEPDLLIGFGGGKILDVAKLSAGMNNIRFISIPTILSNDGISSPVSVITDRDGIPVSHLTKPAYGIIIDFNIIKKAPTRHLRAGVGDLISNLSAVFDCRLAVKQQKEKINPEILRLAESGAEQLLRLKTAKIKDQKFLECLCDGLLKSGLAMCLVGSSRPASGSEHKISHSLDYLFPGRDALHGEQVGIATLFTMALQKNQYLKSVISLYQRIKFPMRLSYLQVNEAQFVKVVLNAKKFRPQRYTILEHSILTESKIKTAFNFLRHFMD
ncbi:MAG: iron-containing alcohol dehydrogenase [bacterium]